MKIAVLMSTYNGHEFLEKQLDSLACQTVQNNMTVYIRDDGSKDNTFDIIDKWKNILNIVLYKGENIKPARSFWNLMMNSEIQADFYAFCDQDDIWDRDKLEKAINKLSEGYCLYACNCRVIDEYGEVIKMRRLEEYPMINIPRLFVSGFTQGCSMVFTDQLRKQMQTYNICCVPMHDILIVLYALNYGRIFWDQKCYFGYRVHSNNVVAKNGKTFLARIKTTYWNWKNSAENSMADVAKEMLVNCKRIEDSDKEFLLAVANYKESVLKKIKIISDKKVSDTDFRERRSFRIRVLLNLY